MATSVSSERAFLQGGITISKRRNRLKGDLVEALQRLKCRVRQDLLFKAPDPSSTLEDIDGEAGGLTEDGEQERGSAEAVEDEASWDVLLDDDDDIYDDEITSETVSC